MEIQNTTKSKNLHQILRGYQSYYSRRRCYYCNNMSAVVIVSV